MKKIILSDTCEYIYIYLLGTSYLLAIRNHKSYYKGIDRCFSDFCKQHPIPFVVVTDNKLFKIRKGDDFIVLDDQDLERIVRYSIEIGYTLGEEMGIVSYNETSLKGIIANGIATISSDFAHM